MIRVTAYSKPEDVKARLRAASVAAAEATVRHATAELKQVLSEPYPPASEPGQPPHTRTGAGKDAVSATINPRDSSAGIYVKDTGKHLTYLEFGTRHVAPRPWFSVTLRRIMPDLYRIALQAVKGILR
jgi:hypothetical protein